MKSVNLRYLIVLLFTLSFGLQAGGLWDMLPHFAGGANGQIERIIKFNNEKRSLPIDELHNTVTFKPASAHGAKLGARSTEGEKEFNAKHYEELKAKYDAGELFDEKERLELNRLHIQATHLEKISEYPKYTDFTERKLGEAETTGKPLMLTAGNVFCTASDTGSGTKQQQGGGGGAAAQQVGKVGFLENCTPDQLEFFQPRMYATDGPGSNWGILSKSGFLGNGESLKERVEADLNTCRELGTSPEKLIAELLSAIKNEQDFDTTYTRYCGHQYCPFSLVDSVQEESPFAPVKGACDSNFVDIEIQNRRTGKTMKISALTMHLVDAHHFFEGNVKYRIDVHELKQLLELPGNDGIP